MTGAQLAQALRRAVIEQDFDATADAMQGGAAIDAHPSIDLAVAAFAPATREPVCANVMYSREYPRGIVAQIAARCGAVTNVRYLADQRDEALRSVAWLPGADWSRMRWRTLAGNGPARFVAPYPASLLKMMVAVGVALQAEAGRIAWPEAQLEAMVAWSDDVATTELVALLHRVGGIAPLQQRLADCGLTTLRLEGTQPDGGWGNAAGAGVGMIQMTAWDSVRLMWLLDEEAPPPPWLAPGTRLLSPAGRRRLRAWLADQRCNEILSSASLTPVPGWVQGLAPEAVEFAHKTGTTENYASDAGIVRARPPRRRHYIVAVITNLGRRYTPDPRCATTWRLPALGAALDAALAPWLEEKAPS